MTKTIDKIKEKCQGNITSDFIIEIYEGETGVWQGKLKQCTTGTVKKYNSLSQLLLLIQKDLEENDFPRVDSEIRSWFENPYSLQQEN